MPPACSLQGASRASVFLMPTLSCFLFLSLQGDIRRHPSSPSHQLSPWTHQASGPQPTASRQLLETFFQPCLGGMLGSSKVVCGCGGPWVRCSDGCLPGTGAHGCPDILRGRSLSLYIRFLQMVSRPASPVHGCPSVSCPCSSSSALSAQFPFGRVWWEQIAVLGVLG